MTNEELRIVHAVLHESPRLSSDDADALAREIARRCGHSHPPAVASVCQVEHAHWGGPMICGNTMPCPKHGGR